AHQDILKRLRQVQYEHALNIRDVGFLPEGEIHSRSERSTPYEMGRDEQKYTLQHILETAEIASRLRPDAVGWLKEAFQEKDSGVRYWPTLGFLMRGKDGVRAARDELRKALTDESPYVRIVAAEALGKYGDADDLNKALSVLLELAPLGKNNVYVSIAALNALDELDKKATPGLAVVKGAAKGAESLPQRMNSYVPRLVEKITANLR